MTMHFIPPVARQEKPPRAVRRHPDVSGKQLSDVPGVRGLPVFGILPYAVLDPLRFATAMYERYGPVHRFHACGSWNVQLIGPEANEFVLADKAQNFSSEGGWKPVFGRHFDGGLLLRDGADHQWHRKLVGTAFKHAQLESYAAIFAANIRRRLPTWSGVAPDLYEFAQAIAFANGFEAFLGLKAEMATRADLLAFRYLMGSATAVVTKPLPGTAEARARWAKKHVRTLLAPMLDAPVADERRDLLAVLLRMKQHAILDDDEIAAHLTFVIAASFDTLSSATLAVLYYLAAHPEWQSAVRAELLAAVPCSRKPRMDQLSTATLSGWCIDEAIRLNAPAPVLWRRAVRPFDFAGYSFPEGTITGVNPMITHLMASVWKEPSAFDPLRFSPDEARQRHRFAFVPFGGGVHACLGANYATLQLKVLLRCVLDAYELQLVEPRPPRWYHWPNCRPRGRLRLRFRPR